MKKLKNKLIKANKVTSCNLTCMKAIHEILMYDMIRDIYEQLNS